MSLANALKKVATASLKKLGGDVVIKRITERVYNVDSGTFFQNETLVTVKGFISNVLRSETNELIESQDKRLTISAGDITFVPTTQDRVISNDVEFKIIQVFTTEQNNTPISFDLILR